MPNKLDKDGLTIATTQENVAFLTIAYEQIYGPDIDLTSSSQDGQMLEIFVQVTVDVETIVQNAYSARDINQAIGDQLDTLIYWIQRLGGTFTIQPVSITTTQALTLFGLDQTTQPVYTVADGSGNEYQLLTTQVIGSAGVNSFSFQSALPGNISSAQNTITVPVVNVLGVSAINNPNSYTVLGINEETDAAFRLRGLASTSIPAQGFFDSLFSTLSNTPNETKTILIENYGGTTSPNATCSVPGVPPHCIWVITQGNALPATIAQEIYAQRTEGCNMKGVQTWPITQKDGSIFVVQWDVVEEETFYTQFTATSIDGINPPKIAAIIAQLPALVQPQIGAVININQIQAAVTEIDPNTLVTGCGLSTSSMGPFTNTLAPTAANYQFDLQPANIFITPMILLPQVSTVAPSSTTQFTGYGGTQTGYTYSILVNNSSGSINSGTGVYTAGTNPGTDTVKVVDSASNSATALITVT